MSIPKSFKNWLEDNYIELLDIAFATNSDIGSVAGEKYQIYLESICDRDN